MMTEKDRNMALAMAMMAASGAFTQPSPYKRSFLQRLNQGMQQGMGGLGQAYSMMGENEDRAMKKAYMDAQMQHLAAQTEESKQRAKAKESISIQDLLGLKKLEKEEKEAADTAEANRTFSELQQTSQIPPEQKPPYVEAMLKNLGVLKPDLVTKYREQERKEEPKMESHIMYGPKGATDLIWVKQGEKPVIPKGWTLTKPASVNVSIPKEAQYDKERNSAIKALKEEDGIQNPTETQIAAKKRDMFRGLSIEEAVARGIVGGGGGNIGGGAAGGPTDWIMENGRLVPLKKK